MFVVPVVLVAASQLCCCELRRKCGCALGDRDQGPGWTARVLDEVSVVEFLMLLLLRDFWLDNVLSCGPGC